MSLSKPNVELDLLINQFYPSEILRGRLGTFESVDSAPSPFSELLDHHNHMTVTVEAFHGQTVDVAVHRTTYQNQWYAREITLVTTQSRETVQYGIVLLNTLALDETVWKEIESEQTPLGRVLIEHNVLREVQLCGLWRVCVGESLAKLLNVQIGEVLFGRTALIYCDGEPAIELLEIVTPEKATL